jgi:hypothetical protein
MGSAENIARTYTALGLVELAFGELKGQYRIDQMPSAKRAVVETLGLRRLHRPARHAR